LKVTEWLNILKTVLLVTMMMFRTMDYMVY